MCEAAALPGVVGLIRDGLLDLRHCAVKALPLDDVNAVVTRATVDAGPFKLAVLEP